MKVYIKEGKIVKKVSDAYAEIEAGVDGAVSQTVAFQNNDDIIYENGSVILFKDSQAKHAEKEALEALSDRDDLENERLAYLNTLLA